ncbi:MAG: response regulator [Spirochaetes bacterium]|nr:response regulator [Spirochaetota bacterium]
MNENNQQPVIVIVDDDEMTRYTLRKKLSKFGYNVISLDKAEDALYLLKNKDERCDFIITEIKLRKMDGIELLRHISSSENSVPVILIGQGNIEDAVKALRYGAIDFLRKPVDVNEIASIIRTELKRKSQDKLAVDFGQFCCSDKREFSLPASIEILNIIAHELTKNLPGIGICSLLTAENIALALREAINNAMFHGNLEISSAIREKEGLKIYNEKIEERKNDPHYGNRRVRVKYDLTPEYVEYIIEDEGPGFDYSSIPDPRDPENFFNRAGRGLLIIKLHMDSVEWMGRGNILKIRKNRVK